MSNAVIDGEATVTKKKKEKTIDAADGQAQEKSKKAENNDDTESEKDNGKRIREKKEKKQEEEEEEKKTKWDDVDLKKILKKEKGVKGKIEVLDLSLPHKLGAIIFFACFGRFKLSPIYVI